MNWVAMFPGQGSQQIGMGEELLSLYPELLIEKFENTLGWSLEDIISNGDEELIKKTNIAQPYIFAISYCYGLETIKKIGKPRVGIGHSLGEYTALTLANTLSYQDALKIISVRGKAMQEAVENSNTTMAAVLTTDLKQTIKAINELTLQGIDINISNYNDSSQIVIGGTIEDVEFIKSDPKSIQAKRIIPLEVAGAFHSPTVSSAKVKVAEVIEDIEFKEGDFTVYMNIDAKPMTTETVKSRLINQIDNSVLFYDQILNIEKIYSPDYWYHIGPGNVTVGMVKKSISSKGLGVINSISSLNEI